MTANDMVHSVPPSPALYVSLALYAAATVLYLVALMRRPADGASRGQTWLDRLPRLCLLAAFIAQGVEISLRGIAGVHPGSSVREALGFLAWLTVLGFLIAGLRYRLRALGALLAPAAFTITAAAWLSPPGKELSGLSLLGRIHISLATLGAAIFALATALAGIYLMEEHNLKRKRFDRVLFRRGAALETMDKLSHRLVLVGFPIFTVAMVLGFVWLSERGEQLLSVRTGMATVAWLVFLILIVARTATGWRGRRAAWLTVGGFAATAVVFLIYLLRPMLG
ncbi:MAG TPA: cytochrome c biogenesis protein CcsA [Kofleriaceae bacterium]|nr:cytochrome c biogenesis protein CcsA [Kofleriaceae bacterium]